MRWALAEVRAAWLATALAAAPATAQHAHQRVLPRGGIVDGEQLHVVDVPASRPEDRCWPEWRADACADGAGGAL